MNTNTTIFAVVVVTLMSLTAATYFDNMHAPCPTVEASE